MVKPKNLSDLWARDPLIHSPILGWRRARRQIIPSTATCHGHGRNITAFSHGTWKRFHVFSMKILSLKKKTKIYHGQKIALLWHGHPCHSAILWKIADEYLPMDCVSPPKRETSTHPMIPNAQGTEGLGYHLHHQDQQTWSRVLQHQAFIAQEDRTVIYHDLPLF